GLISGAPPKRTSGQWGADARVSVGRRLPGAEFFKSVIHKCGTSPAFLLGKRGFGRGCEICQISTRGDHMKKMIGKVALSLAAMAFAGTASATYVATSGSFDGPNKTLQDYLQTWSGGTIAPGSNFVNTNQY